MTQLHPGGASAPTSESYNDDPFFKRYHGSTWNACIGEQGDEENYLDGYIEAAMELSGLVIDKQLYAKRDTLILPILYNARHAVELLLKFVTARLVDAELMPEGGSPHHDIKTYFDRIEAANLGDEKLSKTIRRLKPFVESLSRIDDDGQELRYHVNRFDDPSLADYSLANLEVIRTSLTELSEIISVLKNRVICFVRERGTGLFTKRCSRRDLVTIAQLIPRRDSWRSALFDQQKSVVKSRFKLSNREFSDALNAIQTSRETKAIIGLETELLHLSDDDIVWFAEQWRRVHPASEEVSRIWGPGDFDEAFFEAMAARDAIRNEVISEIEKRITGDKLAEIEAIYYLGRDGIYSEHYEKRIDQAKREHAAEKDAKAEIMHLIDKTNFLRSVRLAAPKLGRLALVERLAKL
jgi:hypothetical protein